MPAARTASALLISAVLAVGAAGCGGSDTSYEEVPGAPATVPIPNDSSALEGGPDSGSGDADADADADATETPTPTPTPTPDASGAVPDSSTGATDDGTADSGAPAPTGGTDTGTTDDGGGAAAPTDDSPTADATPEPGSDAQQFEDFCSQNPGAC
jgi:hypothetical protein